MTDSYDQKTILKAQKEILACLNAKSDNRATSKELIDNATCPADVFCHSIKLLNVQGFVKGPEFTEEIFEEGGSHNFRDSTKLTEKGQEQYISIIKEEQSG